MSNSGNGKKMAYPLDDRDSSICRVVLYHCASTDFRGHNEALIYGNGPAKIYGNGPADHPKPFAIWTRGTLFTYSTLTALEHCPIQRLREDQRLSEYYP